MPSGCDTELGSVIREVMGFRAGGGGVCRHKQPCSQSQDRKSFWKGKRGHNARQQHAHNLDFFLNRSSVKIQSDARIDVSTHADTFIVKNSSYEKGKYGALRTDNRE